MLAVSSQRYFGCCCCCWFRGEIKFDSVHLSDSLLLLFRYFARDRDISTQPRRAPSSLQSEYVYYYYYYYYYRSVGRSATHHTARRRGEILCRSQGRGSMLSAQLIILCARALAACAHLI